MLQGNKNDIEKLLSYVSERLQKALAYVAATDFSKVENGEYDTEPKADRRPEKHNDYIDVQFVAHGEEAIWYTPLTADCVETENKAEKEDVIFYADPQEKNCAILNSCDFAIFFPWELHRPNCSVEKTASNVQKIVVKVKA